jgi:hypothetical protein
VKSETPKLVLACPTATKIVEKELKCTAIEAATIVKVEWLAKLNGGRIEDELAFKQLLELLQPNKAFSDGLGIKHPWAVDGGVGNKSRWPYGVFDPAKPDETFEGFLLFCLKDSSFK